MSVLSYVVLVLVGAIAVFSTPSESSDISSPLSTNLSCTSDQTECLFGCCPYAEAVCCADGYECCQHGQTCIPIIGICLEIVGKRKKVALVSSKATPVKNLVTFCPSGTTTCGPDNCCPLPDAVCCSDGEHCCPRGYRCDVTSRLCLRSSENEYYVLDLPATIEMRSFEPVKTVRKSPYKLCPGGAAQCPSYMSCCLNDEGRWGCCPKPASPLYSKGSNDCCETILGYACCRGLFPICTFMGCL